MPEMSPLPPKDKKVSQALLDALKLFWELGFIIAIPVAVLGFGGAFLDRVFGTSPLLVLLGMALSLAASGLGVFRMIQRVNEDQKAEEASGNQGS